MQIDFHRNWTPPSQLEPHIVRISPRKRLHFNATKENIALQSPPQHLSVWKDNLKRLRTNSVLLHLITNFLLHKHENTSHDYSQCLVMREKFVNWSKRQVTMCSWRKRQRRGLNSPLIALSTTSPISLSSKSLDIQKALKMHFILRKYHFERGSAEFITIFYSELQEVWLLYLL